MGRSINGPAYCKNVTYLTMVMVLEAHVTYLVHSELKVQLEPIHRQSCHSSYECHVIGHLGGHNTQHGNGRAI